jgi:GR25 family glycosyltransferase involved in LPS biosynthesis
MNAHVITLQRRPDRYSEFKYLTWAPLKGFLTLTRHDAVDGRTLVFDAALRSRVNPWNFDNLTEARMRGVIGCALSHLAVLQTVAASAAPALVFEDDARLIDPGAPHFLRTALGRLPGGYDLVWLNAYNRGASHLERATTCGLLALGRPLPPRFVCWPARFEKTTEAYIVSPRGAAKLAETRINNVGAFDEHVRSVTLHHVLNAYCLTPPVFKQHNMHDTDIQRDLVPV